MRAHMLAPLTAVLVGVTIVVSACAPPQHPLGERTMRSTPIDSTETARPAPPSPSAPIPTPVPTLGGTQLAPPPSLPIPTPVPTLGAERWNEPKADRAIVVEVPAPSRGQDLYLVKPDGSPPIPLAHFRENVDAAQASPDGKYLALKTSPHYGVGNEDLLLLSMKDRRVTPIDRDTNIYSFAWAPTGDAIVYSAIPEARRLQIMLYTLGETAPRVLFEWKGIGGWRVVGWDSAGEKVFLAHHIGGGLLGDEVGLLDVGTGEMERIYEDPKKRTAWVLPAPDGKGVLITRIADIHSPEQELLLLDVTSGALTSLAKPGDPASLLASMPLWSPDSRRLAYTVTERAPKGTATPWQVVILDVFSNRLRVVTEVTAPGILVRPLGWASDHVLVVNNLGGETLEQVVYSIRDDGTNALRITWGRFLATVP